MKTKRIATFLGGALAAVAMIGAGWYFWSGTAMEGMSMGGGMGEEMGGDSVAQAAVMISPVRRQLIGVKTETVREQPLETAIRTVGTVDFDERRIKQISVRVA
ncbi:MAG: hypothetical protein AB1515_04600, partial [Nitrospirota bacterium]